VTATYPIAQVRDSKQSVPARAFVDFVLSSAGQSVLGKYGFGRP
jgi:molybdate transport system substrate-binding protein